MNPSVSISNTPEQEQAVHQLIFMLGAKMVRENLPPDTMKHDAHPKLTGLVQAAFTHNKNLPDQLKAGLFAHEKTLPTWVRFSNQLAPPAGVNVRDIRGMALKLMDVPEKKVLEGQQDFKTHDFITISTNVFVTKDVIQFASRIASLVTGKMNIAWYFIKNPKSLWNFFISNKRFGSLLEAQLDKNDWYFDPGDGSGPPGILMDMNNDLWISHEFPGHIIRMGQDGIRLKTTDINICCGNKKLSTINPAPHGIGLDADGETIWFTGKRTSTIGTLNTNRAVQHFKLRTLAALTVYLTAGETTGMRGTELAGNKIMNIQPDGKLIEYQIPTSSSGPVLLFQDPIDECRWFTESSGLKTDKVDTLGIMTEYPIPLLNSNSLLAWIYFEKKNEFVGTGKF